MKYICFIPKDVQKILSSHKSFEKYNELEVFCQKAILKKLAIFTRKNLCSSLFFNKNVLKRNSKTGAF